MATWGAALIALIAALTAQGSAPSGTVLFLNARLIPGDGRPAIERSAFLVEGGRLTSVGTADQIKAPAGATRVDLAGKTVMPAIIATHVHPGFQRGLTYAAANYARETVIDDLNRALFFGVSTVQSMGIEGGDVLYQIREDQRTGKIGGARLLVSGRGIGAPNAGPGGATYAGIAYEVTTEADCRRAVEELAARKVDMVKIWVDDRNGRAPKLSPPLYRAVIDEARRHGLRVIAHVFYHVDAVDLVDAGVDGFAHLVRDREMDDALVAAIVRKGVFVMGNLTTPLKPTYASLPPWLTGGDPMLNLLAASSPPSVVERMQAYYGKRDAKAVEGARQRYGILQRSMAKLAKAGAKIVLGADTGLEDHLFGFAEQLELQAMVEAGLTPAQAIVAATSRAAEFLHLDDRGALVPGRRADFLVLDANPLDDITNTRRLSRVYINGGAIDRDAIAPRR
jgi:imidazolonepropionase-like amidohydrolase